MENTETQPESRSHTKDNILIGIVLISAITTMAQWLIESMAAYAAYNIITLLSGVGFLVGMLLWTQADAQERKISLSPSFRLAAIVFGLLTLIYYLFKSRGLCGGFISLGWLALFVLGLFVLNVIISTAFALIYGRLDPFV